MLDIWSYLELPENYQAVYIALFLWLVYLIMFKPMNTTKDLESVGWTDKKSSNQNRKTRKVGNLPPVYPNGWFMVAESDEIRPGQVRHITALGENLAVFRTLKGVCRVTDAYCPHLGANMAVGGTVQGDCLECPFHNWRFRGDTGQCTSIPNANKIPKTAQVKSWPCCERNDFIFVWYHAEGEEPTWSPPSIEGLASRRLGFSGRNQFIANCHIQEIPENGSDLAHFEAIHSASVISGGDLRYQERAYLQFMRHHWSATWEPSTEPDEEHIAKAFLVHHVLLFNRIQLVSTKVHVTQMGPGYVQLNIQTSLGLLILIQSVTPIGPLLQKIVHRIYSPFYLTPYAKLMLIGETSMIERDIMIWNNKTYLDTPVLVKEDKSIGKYRRWFSQFYSKNSPLYSEAVQTYDW